MQNNLIGSWISDPEFSKEKVQIDFTEDGHLIYTTLDHAKSNLIFMTYRIENDVIISDQPSHPREERTKFKMTSDGKLILIFGNEEFRYVRCAEQTVK